MGKSCYKFLFNCTKRINLQFSTLKHLLKNDNVTWDPIDQQQYIACHTLEGDST